VNVEHIKGKKTGDVMLYALSTCGWCHKTKELLTSLGVDFDYVFVDLLPDAEREDTLKIVQKWNPKSSFPTIVINNNSIVGFKEDEIKKALKL
jgi:glutaredoxin-like protein NrdH